MKLLLIFLYFFLPLKLLAAEEKEQLNFNILITDVCYSQDYERVRTLFSSSQMTAVYMKGTLDRFCSAIFSNAFEKEENQGLYAENYTDRSKDMLKFVTEPSEELNSNVLLAGPQLFLSLDPIRSENVLNQAYQVARNNNIGSLILINKTGQCMLQKRDDIMRSDSKSFWSLMVNYPRYTNQKNSIRSPIITSFYAIEQINSFLRRMIDSSVTNEIEKQKLTQWIYNKNLSKDIFIVTEDLKAKVDPCTLNKISFKDWLLTKAASERQKGNELYSKIILCANTEISADILTPEATEIYQKVSSESLSSNQDIAVNSGTLLSSEPKNVEANHFATYEELLNYRFLSWISGKYGSTAISGEDPRNVNLFPYMSERGKELFLGDWSIVLSDCTKTGIECRKMVPSDPRNITNDAIKMLNNYLDIYYLYLLTEMKEQILTNFYQEKRFTNSCANLAAIGDIKSVSMKREFAIEGVSSFSSQIGREVEKAMNKDIIYNNSYTERDNQKFYVFGLKKLQWLQKENNNRVDINLRKQLEEHQRLGQAPEEVPD